MRSCLHGSNSRHGPEHAANGPKNESYNGMRRPTLAEHPSGEPIPVVNFGGAGVVRCDSCRAYINPFVQFMEGGRSWKCNMCGKVNQVKKQYFCHLDGSGKRMDLADRPELRKVK